MTRILCIDDSPPVCRTLRMTLRSLGEVQTVTSTEADAMLAAYATMMEGLRELIDNPPDVVVLDGLEGYNSEVLQAAKDLEVPVVAYTSSPERFRGADVPVAVKPDTGGLLRALRGVLERQDPPTGHDMNINTDTTP